MGALIGIENAARETGATATKGSWATNYEASKMLDESPSLYAKSSDTKAASTRTLVTLPKTREVRTLAGHEDTLGRHGLWRATLGTAAKPPVRWGLAHDGVDDQTVSTATLTQGADLIMIGRFRIPTQPILATTANNGFFAIVNGADSFRMRVIFRAGSAGVPYAIQASVTNYGAGSSIGSALTLKPDGGFMDVALAYRNSDKLASLYVDGVLLDSGIVTTAWSDNGAERLVIGASRVTTGEYAMVEAIDVQLWNVYDTTRITGYDAEILTGEEYGLLESWHFTEGTGTTATGSKGTVATITGASWVERVNPSPVAQTTSPSGLPQDGVLEARGQWRRRQAFRLKPGSHTVSPVISSATRTITLRGLLRIDPLDVIVDGGVLAYVGPSAADAELSLITQTGGYVALRSYRGGTFTIPSLAVVNDGTLRRWRLTLNGYTGALQFWLASDGAAEVSQGTDTAAAFATLANCVVGIGDPAELAEVGGAYVADVAQWREVVLEAEDDMTMDRAGDPRLVAHVPLGGMVRDAVDQTRTYTTAAATYGEIEQTATRALPAADERLVEDARDAFERTQRSLIGILTSAVNVTQIYLELWDAENADGYLSVGTLLTHATWESSVGVAGETMAHEGRAIERSADGVPSAKRDWRKDRIRLDLGVLTLAERRELLARLRLPSDRLILAITDTTVPQHLLGEHAVVGIAKGLREFAKSDIFYTTTLEVESVRRPSLIV